MSVPAPSKVVSLADLAARIGDGTSIAVGGSFLHRGPFALMRELVRQKKKDLEIIKPSPGYDVDMLCRAGAVAKCAPASSRWKATSASRAGSGRPSSARKRGSKNTPE